MGYQLKMKPEITLILGQNQTTNFNSKSVHLIIQLAYRKNVEPTSEK